MSMNYRWIAEKYLESISMSNCRFAILDSEDFKEGIHFNYQTVEFVETGNWDEMMIGTFQFIVDKATGEVFHNPEFQLNKDEYIEKFRIDKLMNKN